MNLKHEIIIDFLTTKTQNIPASIHVDMLGLIRLGSNQTEMMQHFLNILEEVKLRGGNILIPTYSYSLTKNEIFNLNETPSTIGKFSNFLSTQNIQRTHDGIFSYAVFSKNKFYKHLEKNMCYDSFGKDSLIHDIFNQDGYLCALGCGLDTLTEIHYLERLLNVPYRSLKEFTGTICSKKESYKQVNSFFCRDFSFSLRSYFGALYDDLKDNDLVESWEVKDSFQIEAIRFSVLYDFIKQKYSQNPYYLCRSI